MNESVRVVSSPMISPDSITELRNIECEAALLGGMMIDNGLVFEVAQILTGSDFFEAVHGRIFDCITARVAAGESANPITLKSFLAADITLTELGGLTYLAQLTGNSAALIGAKHFAVLIAELSKRRALYVALSDAIISLTSHMDDKLDDIVAKIDGDLSAAIRVDDTKKNRTIARAWDTTMTSIDAMAKGANPGWWIDGLPDWNKLLQGMMPGDLIVLAGRPGMGKTAVALGVALGCARAGIGCDFFSLEMSEDQLMQRAITDVCFDFDRGSFTYANLQRGKLNAVDRDRINQARQTIDQWPLRFYEPSSTKIGRIIMEMRRRKRAAVARDKRLDVFIVDYLQLLRGDKDRDNKNHEISEITRDLKLAAKELGVAIVLLSQLSRAVEQREDKRPQMSDLRDSGSIEQDADAIIFIYRAQYYLEANEPAKTDKRYADWEVQWQTSRDRVELIARKVRKGSTNSKTCQFFLAHQAVRGSDFFSEVRS